ncbi:hypothetical protein PP175_09385 [Aneurinibacillus sp. Ricciae_BoGa-3]|uniref:hypothetical protein n=1 Tax=Aneurinibacillus sp. Ricciae_BoGa-3 TaxID=3022697 RepID=UPI0023428740|nr:hypothetical protein [Aneurinibacillus sp. Ricciae_BoGa-3]WCK56096.1 hypothetical protein PP175_09385 [Aneurinibacillus sp. Ricciae_BoGa-3]
MKLSDALGRLDISQLSGLAAACRCECNPHSKHELIQSLYVRLTRRSFFSERFASMSAEEKRFLLQLTGESKTEYGKGALYVKTRLAGEKKLAGGAMILRAMEGGWLYRTRHEPEVYSMPDDIRMGWRRYLHKLAEQLAFAGAEPEWYRDETHVLAEDLLVFLHFVKKNNPPLSKENVLYRNHQQQIMGMLSVAEELPGKGEWRFGYGRRFNEYPDRFALLYDYAYANRLIQEEDANQLYLTDEGHKLLLSASGTLEDVSEPLFIYWKTAYSRPIPTINGLLSFFSGMASWTEETALIETVKELVSPYYYDSFADIIQRRLLKMLVHTGILQKGTYGSSAVYRLSVWGNFIINKYTKL